jgi:1,4-alpha-glucan branching enzyme
MAEEEVMLIKHYSKKGDFCRVTFKLPPEVAADEAAVCGDFNNWDPGKDGMRRLRNGGFSLTLSLPSGRTYRFRYLLDGVRWENDEGADGYLPNPFGSEDSLARL